MLLDIHELDADSVQSCDLCIIGSGAAGIALAREFNGTKHAIVVLEAGGVELEADSQDPYQSEVLGRPHQGIHAGRARILGGSTTMWAGQALPLLDIDFAKRDWVPHSGWPFDKATLDPFYRRAEDVMQVPHISYDSRSWPRPTGPLRYAHGSVDSFYSQFTSTPNFAHKYRAEISASANIRLITHANVTSLEASAGANHIREARARSLDGHAILVQARHYVVCCGGIDTARLLLASDSVERDGIGNSRDVVGRYFGDHHGASVPVKVLDKRRFHAGLDSGRRAGLRYTIKAVASEELQRSQCILNTGGEVYYPPEADDPVGAAKDLLRALRPPHLTRELSSALARTLRRPHKLLAACVRHYVLDAPPSVGSTPPRLGFGGEQQPNPESRVKLSQQRDVLGMRRTALHWRLTEAEHRSAAVYIAAVKEQWSQLGIASIDPADIEVALHQFTDAGQQGDNFHHIGTTRMGDDSSTSVVDANCCVHGYDNLHIGSSSVFPTGGFSNPTLTIIALCLRLADRLKQQLAA
jgi:choline dehydrogenase-like flavoprotein